MHISYFHTSMEKKWTQEYMVTLEIAAGKKV